MGRVGFKVGTATAAPPIVCSLLHLPRPVTIRSSPAVPLSPCPPSPDYATSPLIGNRLVPLATGSATLTVAFGGDGAPASAAADIAVSVVDTYAPAWPRAGNATDTTAALAANMTAPDLSVIFRLVASAALDLDGAPPTASSVEGSGAVTLVADPSGGPNFFSATATGLKPGTNYTALLAVRSGATLASGVTALSGLLVPDTRPPDFTGVRLLDQPADGTAPTGTFKLSLDVGVSEAGAVAYAVYHDGGCLTGEDREGERKGGGASSCWVGGGLRGATTQAPYSHTHVRASVWGALSLCVSLSLPLSLAGEPTLEELRAGTNLHDVGKCRCGSALCAAAARGRLVFPDGAALSAGVDVTGALPANPFDALRDASSAELVCGPDNCECSPQPSLPLCNPAALSPNCITSKSHRRIPLPPRTHQQGRRRRRPPTRRATTRSSCSRRTTCRRTAAGRRRAPRRPPPRR